MQITFRAWKNKLLSINGRSQGRRRIKAGDKVVMNEKYVVAEKYRGQVFTVRSHPFDICGTECVLLEGYNGGFAVDGLMLVEKQKNFKNSA